MTPRNVFVLGDLVIDHTVYIEDDYQRQATSRDDERIYRVLRRQDTLGGAANCARILAVLNSGHTFLWGIHGHSPWGTFAQLLAYCLVLDGAESNIEFRGVLDDTGATMNSISRLIKLDDRDYSKRTIVTRFDDYGNLCVSGDRLETSYSYLERETEKHGIDSIVINDFDMGALSARQIQRIADFAEERSIPLFVDPKYTKDKYQAIPGTVLAPNLHEWCILVGGRYPEWRKRVRGRRQEHLTEMAYRSARGFPGFKYHIITCDVDGMIIIGPHPASQHCHAIYHIAAQADDNSSSQIACGDTLIAALALYYEHDLSSSSADEFFMAILKANAVAACVQDMKWHQMPTHRAVSQAFTAISEDPINPIASAHDGILYLPADSNVFILDGKTAIHGIVSVNDSFVKTLDAIVRDVSGESERIEKSIILTAPGGHGKSKILEGLENLANSAGVSMVNAAPLISGLDADQIPGELKKLINGLDSSGGPYVILMDEAMKLDFGKFLLTTGIVSLMNRMKNGRFLFADADFPRHFENIDSQIMRRCVIYELSGICERPKDIAYIVGSVLLSLELPMEAKYVEIESSALITLINSALEVGTISLLCEAVQTAHASAARKIGGKPPGAIEFKDIPRGWRRAEDQTLPSFIHPSYRYPLA